MSNGTDLRDGVPATAHLIAVARGQAEADLAIRGGSVFLAHTREWLDADVLIAGARIAAVVERGSATAPQAAAHDLDAAGRFVVPGFIDAHVHIESSKLTPAGFAEAVLRHGTTTVVAEPHEIASVLGVAGVRWLMEACEGLPLDVRFMVPSCVPASRFESPGHSLALAEMEELLEHPRMLGVGELMNFPGVLAADDEVLARMGARGATHVDGHAPGLGGRDLDGYTAGGIRSDHESTHVAEAHEKLRRGMWVLLREASNARNLADLLPLLRERGTDWCAFCTDDREPDDLLRHGQINLMCRMAVAAGVPAEDALVLATLNAASAHGLTSHGAIAPGRYADVLLLPDLERFEPEAVVARGRVVVRAGGLAWQRPAAPPPASVCDTMHLPPLAPGSLVVRASEAADGRVRVVGVRDGQLLTSAGVARLEVSEGVVQPDRAQDIARLAVVERHQATGRIGRSFVRGFGLREGAIASTVAHDAHNLVLAGLDEDSMLVCARRLGEIGGGIAVARGGEVIGELALPVAGLMSDEPVTAVVERLTELHAAVRELGGTLAAPFMALSFLALSVIPTLKLTDRGLLDVERFELVPIAADAGLPASR